MIDVTRMDLDVVTGRDAQHRQERAAAALKARGVTEGDRIALLADGSTHYVCVVAGALRCGVIPVPLDPRLTPVERDRAIADLEPALVLNRAQIETLTAHETRTEIAPWPRARPMHLTSGTTGRPKGVWSGLLSDAHAEALMSEERDLWGFASADRNIVVSPVYHSAPLRFALGTLLAGGSVAVLPRFEPSAFLTAVEAFAPTTMFCVPAHLQRLFTHLDEHDITADLTRFRLVAHAGAPCPTSVRRRAHAEFGMETVWEFYGSTEGQFTACRAEEWYRRPGTLGRARPGRYLFADEDGLLWCVVPDHARFTYWRDDAKTEGAWRTTERGPAFTVGDLGRVDEDGYVYLDARREDLIITGGVNVYPAEIEDALREVPGVEDAAVFGVDDSRWGQRVCAAIVGDVDEVVLRSAIRERLSPPKRPKDYVRVSALPRTPTGKIRRGDLSLNGRRPPTSP